MVLNHLRHKFVMPSQCSLCANFLCFLWWLWRLYPSWAFSNSESWRRLLHTLLVANSLINPRNWNPSTLHTLAAIVSQYFVQVTKPEPHLSLCTPCMAHVTNCTSEGMRTKAIYPELSETNLWTLCQHTPCGQFNCTPSRNSCSDRETIETHFPYSLFLSDFKHFTRNHTHIA